MGFKECSYNPRNNFIETHMYSIGKVIDSLTANYKNFILIGDLNAGESNTTIKDFGDMYSFKNLIKGATCFKNPEKSKHIDRYRDHKNFSNDAFWSGLVIKNGNLQNDNDLDSFLAKCKDVLNRTARLK